MLCFLNEDALFLFECTTVTLRSMDTFLVNLQCHIPGYKVPDLKEKILNARQSVDEPGVSAFIS